jgi:gamma-glutamyltranspeptidase / glutathione hydrolase
MFFIKRAVSKLVLAVLAFVITCSLYAQNQPILDYESRFHPSLGKGGMVVSQEMLASEAGASILRQGGNAVDAAVATGFALAVTLPQAGNLGGGGFMLVHLAQANKTIAIDYREMAPALSHRDMFLDTQGEPDPELSRFSALSSGVPGTVAGLIHAHRHYGKLPLKTVMAPAIELAKRGFDVSYTLAWSLKRAQDRLKQHPASSRYFFGENGEPLSEGDRWRQPDLAKTLRRIADTNGEDFYTGQTAKLLVAEMARIGGTISREDLANYRVVERQPVTGTYRGYQVVSMPPPSSGGVHLLQMLNILEGWPLAELGHNSAGYLHRLIETMRYAYADRSRYLGDPDFVEVPAGHLIDKRYGHYLRDKILLDKATSSKQVAPNLEAFEESPQTTHFSSWDEEGNVVSNTYTLNFSYGNGIAVTGAGFLLNNEMDDFSAKTGEANAYGLIGSDANAVAPGKRPLSSMTPTLVFRDGVPVLATGSPGGSRIITAVLQTVLNVVDFDMNIAEAAAAPRIHHQWFPDTTFLESGFSTDTLTLLEAMGHHLEITPWSIGKTQSLSREGDTFYGVSDYRWPGGSAASAR